jgi:hypothetical protein
MVRLRIENQTSPSCIKYPKKQGPTCSQLVVHHSFSSRSADACVPLLAQLLNQHITIS